MKATITIEELAQRMGEVVWAKGTLKRIYLNNIGYNTKKMSTKAYIYEKNGEFVPVVTVDCPCQSYEWADSQEVKFCAEIEERMNRAVNGEENDG